MTNSSISNEAETPISEKIRLMMLKIRVDFQHTLPDHIAAFEAEKRATKFSDTKSLSNDLFARSHKIAGVAETLGFKDLGDTARAFERLQTGSQEAGKVSAAAERLLELMHEALVSD